MRSEVVKCIRSSEATVTVAMGSRVMANVISNIVGDMLKKDQVAMLRISVEILDEKGEEKVWSKVTIRRHEGGARGACMNAAGGWEYLLEAITKDWQPGESRKVKSILFETPSGVPVVEFVETPRERLVNAVKAFDGGGLLESDIVRRVKDYLAATEGEK